MKSEILLGCIVVGMVVVMIPSLIKFAIIGAIVLGVISLFR